MIDDGTKIIGAVNLLCVNVGRVIGQVGSRRCGKIINGWENDNGKNRYSHPSSVKDRNGA